MTRRACLIFNPVSGRSDCDADLEVICQNLTPHFELNIKYTDAEQGIADLLPSDLIDDLDLVVAAGGDGTVSDVSSVLLKRQIPMGILPRGTANAFAKALDIPTTLEDACRAIVYGELRTIDMARYGTSNMILLAGIGLEARTVRDADRGLKDRLGALAYAIAGFNQLKDLESFDVELILDRNRQIALEASAVTVANAAPATSILAHGTAGVLPDDGLLDITVVDPHSSLDAVAASVDLFRSAVKGEVATQRSIQNFRAKRVKIIASPEQPVTVDGELVGQTPIEFECVPQSLTVCIPKQGQNDPVQLPNFANISTSFLNKA